MGKTRRKQKTFNDNELFEFEESVVDTFKSRRKKRNKDRRQHNAFPEVHGCYDEEEDYTSFEKIGKRK